jgi:cytochrome c oxidase subunit IV
MIFTADQLVAHMVGDYILQSHWMATEKTKNGMAALIHASSYTLPFLLITTAWKALFIIFWTHYLIDRFRLARYVVWLKNGPMRWSDEEGEWCMKHITATGYQDDVPMWLSVWLLIITDNTLHVICNGVAIWGFSA